MGLSFEVQKANMLLPKNGVKIQNSAEAPVSYANFDGTCVDKGIMVCVEAPITQMHVCQQRLQSLRR